VSATMAQGATFFKGSSSIVDLFMLTFALA
jgi:hypothetical protein